MPTTSSRLRPIVQHAQQSSPSVNSTRRDNPSVLVARTLCHPLGGILLMMLFALATKLVAPLLYPLPLPMTALALTMLAAPAIERISGHRLNVPYYIPLTAAMVLLGVQFERKLIGTIGLSGLGLMLGFWALVLALYFTAGKLGLLGKRRGMLLATAMTGCGVSAMVAASAADRESDEATQALGIAMVLLLGAIGLGVLPPIVEALELNSAQVGLLAGIGVTTTAEAVLVGAGHSPEALQVTGALRFLVNLLQFLPVLVYVKFYASGVRSQRSAIGRVASTMKRAVPAFTVGLALFALLGLSGAFNESDRRELGNLTNWLFLFTLCGIGLKTRPVELVRSGVRDALVVLTLWLISAGLLLLALVVIG